MSLSYISSIEEYFLSLSSISKLLFVASEFPLIRILLLLPIITLLTVLSFVFDFDSSFKISVSLEELFFLISGFFFGGAD